MIKPKLKSKLFALISTVLGLILCACSSAPNGVEKRICIDSVPYKAYVYYEDVKLGKTPLTLDTDFSEKIANSAQASEKTPSPNIADGDSILKFPESQITIKKIKGRESLYIGNSDIPFSFKDESGNSLDGEVLKLVYKVSVNTLKITVVFKAPPEILKKYEIESEE